MHYVALLKEKEKKKYGTYCRSEQTKKERVKIARIRL